jgi:hypothetical protein
MTYDGYERRPVVCPSLCLEFCQFSDERSDDNEEARSGITILRSMRNDTKFTSEAVSFWNRFTIGCFVRGIDFTHPLVT